MKQRPKIDLGLTGYEELFTTEEQRQDNKLAKIRDIPIAEIDDFPEHPFYVKDDEDMAQLVDSIKERGIITPIIIRQKDDGRYEMISGHRRKHACIKAGLDTIKAEIRDLSRDEAIILMVESNLQRTQILPSEKAFSYKMRLEALKRQAGRPSLNCSPLGNNLPQERSSVEFANTVGESKNQVFRYIRLTNLIPSLLTLVDSGKIAFRPAVEISYLTSEQQKALFDTIMLEEATPSLAQAIKMKDFSKIGKLSDDVILSIMSEQKPNQKEKISFSYERLSPYFPQNMSGVKREQYLINALKYYQLHLEKQKQRSEER